MAPQLPGKHLVAPPRSGPGSPTAEDHGAPVKITFARQASFNRVTKMAANQSEVTDFQVPPHERRPPPCVREARRVRGMRRCITILGAWRGGAGGGRCGHAGLSRVREGGWQREKQGDRKREVFCD